jgi:hypothetical protein
MAAPAIEALTVPKPRWDARLSHVLARHRAASVAAVIAFCIALRLAAGLVLPHPRPYVGDEFSYLLGGETLAAGRLANPQHPMWRFFESPHIIVHPVYASKYPPAQAVLLALCDKLFGDPAAGVFLSVALFAGAVCWALQSFVPASWAVLGGLFVAVSFGPGHYWTESYWGGAVTAVGAALVIGAFRRITALGAPAYGWLFGLGAMILVNSRPYEGGVLVLCLGVLAVIHAWKRKRPRLLLPLVISAALTAAVMAVCNWRVTGHALQLPYALYQAQYGPAPTLWIAGARLSSSYGHAELQRVFEYFIRELNNVLAYPLPQRVGVLFVRLAVVLIFGVGPAAFLPMIFVPALRRDRTVRMLSAITLLVAAAALLDVSMFLHYAAPLVTLLLVLSFTALHRMTRVRSGATISVVILLIMFGAGLGRIGEALAGRNINYPARPPFRLDRDGMVRMLSRDPGQHVVFVRYAPGHNVNIEWVYNGADIDGARVIWAHHLGETSNRALLNYYAGRRFWLLQPDSPHPAVAPYQP